MRPERELPIPDEWRSALVGLTAKAQSGDNADDSPDDPWPPPDTTSDDPTTGDDPQLAAFLAAQDESPYGDLHVDGELTPEQIDAMGLNDGVGDAEYEDDTEPSDGNGEDARDGSEESDEPDPAPSIPTTKSAFTQIRSLLSDVGRSDLEVP